jgi:hypothetical protein
MDATDLEFIPRAVRDKLDRLVRSVAELMVIIQAMDQKQVSIWEWTPGRRPVTIADIWRGYLTYKIAKYNKTTILGTST